MRGLVLAWTLENQHFRGCGYWDTGDSGYLNPSEKLGLGIYNIIVTLIKLIGSSMTRLLFPIPYKIWVR